MNFCHHCMTMLSGEEPCQVSINASVGLTMPWRFDGSLGMNVAKHPAEDTKYLFIPATNVCLFKLN